MVPNTTPKAPAAGQQSEATKIVSKIAEGKVESLLSLIPKGQSPRLFIQLVKDQVLGLDKYNKPRRDEDLLLFLYTCKRTGLDPLTRQIFAVFRWNSAQQREVMTMQTGIDGMRLVAQRSGNYAGQEDIVYTPFDEHTPNPVKATCTVYKMIEGARVPFVASARWGEYVQTDKYGKALSLWAKMPYLMLGKCAEALALRKAFPNELSGLYSEEEMTQANNPVITAPTTAYTYPANPGGIKVMHGKPADMGPTGTAHPPAPAAPGKPPGTPVSTNNPQPAKPAIGTPDAAKAKVSVKPEDLTPAQIMSNPDLSAKEKAEALRKRGMKNGANIKHSEAPKK